MKVWIYKGDVTEKEFARLQVEKGSRSRRGDRRGGSRRQRDNAKQAKNTQTPAPGSKK